MRKAFYSDVATRLAVSRLIKLGYVTSRWEHGDYDQRWIVYSITEAGEDWLVANQGKLELRTGRARELRKATEISDEDIPF
jgi:DNA-binding PadR family transcriptional regulator